MHRAVFMLPLLLLMSVDNVSAAPRRSGDSIPSVLTALYDVISGPAGQARDWNRFRSLFTKDARLLPVVWKGQGRYELRRHTVEEFIASASTYFSEQGFYEREVARRIERFGQIAHVFSTYETFARVDDAIPIARGINSIQLFHDGTCWRIMSIAWDQEREGMPVPEEYLR